jgi:hypothetical protein
MLEERDERVPVDRSVHLGGASGSHRRSLGQWATCFLSQAKSVLCRARSAASRSREPSASSGRASAGSRGEPWCVSRASRGDRSRHGCGGAAPWPKATHGGTRPPPRDDRAQSRLNDAGPRTIQVTTMRVHSAYGALVVEGKP